MVGLFNWREALVIVKPETLIGWHRKGFKLVWRWKSRVGRPRLPERIRKLIVQMIEQNPTWGEERVAAELSIRVLLQSGSLCNRKRSTGAVYS